MDNITPRPSSNYSSQNIEYEPNGIFSVRNIVRLVIGTIVLLTAGWLILTFVIPRVFPSKPSKTSLLYWGLWEDPAVMSVIINEFQRDNPNIEVKYEKQDIKAIGKYAEFLATRIQSGTGPDIFRFHNSWTFRMKNILLPLPTDVISKETESQYYDVYKRDLNISGAYYGIPLQIDTLALFINTDIYKSSGLEKYPATWDDFVTAARRLTVKDEAGIKTAGTALGTYDNIAHASDILSLLLVQNGADLYDLAGKKKKNAVDALDFYTCFAIDRAPDCVKVWDNTLENSKLSFAKGNLAMYFGYSWDIFEIKNLNPNMQFEVVSVPHLAGSSSFRNNTIASYWVDGISSKTKSSKEAFEFLKFLSKKETLEKIYTEQSKQRLFGELYPRRDMRQLLSSNSLVYPFVAQADNAASTIFSSDTHDTGVTSVLNGYLGNSIRSVISSSESPETAIETFARGVAQTIVRSGN